ncbi:hypothetical protein H4S06_003054 [Coemansia sp. BCRC 34490]|nr:hypothetical protein H4S06_003054 [Coemansia sp. BCRC 34490]
MDNLRINNEFASIVASKRAEGLALDTTAKDRLAILVSPANNAAGAVQVTSNLKLFSSGKKNLKIPAKLSLQICRCANVFDGLCALLDTLQNHSGVLKHIVQLDVSFVPSVNNRSNTSADEAKAVAEELVRLLPNVTSYRCAIGVEENTVMCAFASCVAEKYGPQMSSLVCHWKILHNMDRLAKKLVNLEHLVVGSNGKTNALYDGTLELPRLKRLEIIVCSYTLSLLLGIKSPKSIDRVVVSIEDDVLFEMTAFTLDEDTKNNLKVYCNEEADQVSMIVFGNHLLRNDGVATDATVYVHRELESIEVDWISWDNATKLVVTSTIGFADLLMILAYSPKIYAIRAKKIIKKFDEEVKELFEMLDDAEIEDTSMLKKLALSALSYKGSSPADLCAMLSCKTIDRDASHGLCLWGGWYMRWLDKVGLNDIYEMFSDKLMLEGVEYHFPRTAKQHAAEQSEQLEN